MRNVLGYFPSPQTLKNPKRGRQVGPVSSASAAENEPGKLIFEPLLLARTFRTRQLVSELEKPFSFLFLSLQTRFDQVDDDPVCACLLRAGYRLDTLGDRRRKAYASADARFHGSHRSMLHQYTPGGPANLGTEIFVPGLFTFRVLGCYTD